MNEDDLTDLLRDHASRHAVPGAAVGILCDGTVTTAYCGVADVRSGEPVRPDTRFSAGSLTKSMVATVVTSLDEENVLSLDDPVAAHVPELRRSGWAERATLRDLLANRSGLPLRSDLEFGFDGRTDEDDGALSRLTADVAAAPPTADFWSYSNAGWCVLGRAIEAVTGTVWEEAMQHRLLDRASMAASGFTTRSRLKGRVSGHEITEEGAIPVEPMVARAYGPAGTTTVTTATDLLRFAALHLDDPALRALREVHATPSISGWLDAWCLGWAFFDWQGGEVWGWDGLVYGERSILRLVPERHAAVVLMANSGTGRALYRSLFAELMPSLFGITVPPLRLDAWPGAAGDLTRFAGIYAWPDRRVDVTATADALRIRAGQREVDAFPLDAKTFVVDATDPDDPAVTFGAFDEAGRPRALYVSLWSLPRLDD